MSPLMAMIQRLLKDHVSVIQAVTGSSKVKQ